MIDLFLIVIMAVVTWCVAAEGAWGASLNLLCVLLAGILAMNFFEPAAEFLQATIPLGADWQNRWDFIALMGLFTILSTLLRVGVEQIIPTHFEVHPLVHDGVRWIAAGATGYITMAIVLTSLHTAPLPRNFLGFEPERDNLLGMVAPDRQWLGFVQYLSEKAYRNGPNGPIFDGTTTRLSNGQQVVLPSFAIRYASRRELGSPSSDASTNEPSTKPILITPQKSSPGGVSF